MPLHSTCGYSTEPRDQGGVAADRLARREACWPLTRKAKQRTIVNVCWSNMCPRNRRNTMAKNTYFQAEFDRLAVDSVIGDPTANWRMPTSR
jgi:hypothetical protein